MSFRENVPRTWKLTDVALRMSAAYCVMIHVGPKLADEIGMTAGSRMKVLHGEGNDLWKMRFVPCGRDEGYIVQAPGGNGKARRVAFRRPAEFPVFEVFTPKFTVLEGGGVEIDYRAEKYRLEQLAMRDQGRLVNFK